MRLRRPNTFELMEMACKDLLGLTPEAAAWEWDGSYSAALLTVESAHEAEFLARIAVLLPHSWDQLEIAGAPEPVRRASGIWGGLMPGQRFFVLDPEAEPMTFAAWWPWSDRSRCSLRVSCVARTEAVSKADPQAKLRGFFGL